MKRSVVVLTTLALFCVEPRPASAGFKVEMMRGMGLWTASVLLRVERLSDSASLKIENKEERMAFYRTSAAACAASARFCKFGDRK